MKEYKENFNDWADVVNEFQFDLFKEPNHIYAYYEYANYEGDALVAYYKDRKFYVVSGGHCSCYGLEGQWEPTEYTRKTFKAMLDRQKDGVDWGIQKHKAKLLELYEATK